MDEEEKIYQFKCPNCLGVFIHKAKGEEIFYTKSREMINAVCPMCFTRYIYTMQKEGEVNATE